MPFLLDIKQKAGWLACMDAPPRLQGPFPYACASVSRMELSALPVRGQDIDRTEVSVPLLIQPSSDASGWIMSEELDLGGVGK